MQMKTPLLLSLFLLLCGLTQSQYVVKSNNILNPDLNIDYVKINANFWIKNAYDPTYGGFYSSIARNGSILSATQKSLISQTRQGYGMTRAFMLTGDETYLTYAASALKFLCDFGWDKTNEGWFTFAKRDGSLDNRVGWNPNATKWGFTQQYALVGLIANYEATHDDGIKVWMDKGLNSINNHMWDSRPGYEGYFADAALNWSTKTGKGFTPTVDAITTNAELNYLVTQTPESKNRLMQLSDIIVNRFIGAMSDTRVKVLYPENFTNDWAMIYETNNGSVGHFIKTAWCLGRAYLCDTTKKAYRDAAIKILDQTWSYTNNGVSTWDHTNGGPFNAINYATGTWGTGGDNKDYWTLEQGFTGPMINYYITKNPIYLQMADESINFFMNNLVDKTYGEIFSELDPIGTTIRSDVKGDDFKACYHSIELGYYAYLYSNLYYLHQPASLFYKFAPKTSAQQIKLTPIPMEENKLKIKGVTLDGNNYTDYDATTRTLNIAANQGGKFKVTFEYADNYTNSIDRISTAQVRVYPNPAQHYINISGVEDIRLIKITTLSGKLILVKELNGNSTQTIDVSNFEKGIYLIIFESSDNAKLVRKFVKD